MHKLLAQGVSIQHGCYSEVKGFHLMLDCGEVMGLVLQQASDIATAIESGQCMAFIMSGQEPHNGTIPHEHSRCQCLQRGAD